MGTERELLPVVNEFLSKSELIIAQQWLPSKFDWRVLFVAKYFFPRGHWQIIKRDNQQHKLSESTTQAIPVDDGPKEVIQFAQKSANLIGDGFYGVDVK